MVDRDHLRELYNRLTDDELTRIWESELVSDARHILQAEMNLRGLPTPAPKEPDPPPTRSRFSLRNPYLPPGALIADVNAEAAISGRGLVRLFQSMIIASTAIANGIRQEAALPGHPTARRDAYLAMLASGSSKYPIDLLKGAGVDMTTSAPFRAAMKEMNAVMDEMEKLLAVKK